jgi:hypothetical protein
MTTATALRTRNDLVVQAMEPFLVVVPWHRDHLDHRPMGLEIPPCNIIDPMRLEAETFLRRLDTLDRLAFGPGGMEMPGWVFHDCAEVPAAIFGFARRVHRLPADVARRLDLAPGERGLMPLSMYIAMPAVLPGAWFGHNLASLNPIFPDLGYRGLGSITKALALKTFRCALQVGATQWTSPALRIHSRFGPLELMSAWTPAHSKPETLTYRFRVTDAKLRSALGDPTAIMPPREADFEIDATDTAALQRLQERLEAGERLVVADSPRQAGGGSIRVPMAAAARHPAR